MSDRGKRPLGDGAPVEQAGRQSQTRVVRAKARAEDWLVGGGEMGKVLRSMDWSRTPLGAIESWPQSLRTTVSLCLASNFPISLVWGKAHVQIYNDGYWPICGGKHPHSMGQDFKECWASAWPAIGEAFEQALEGHTSYLENQRMFLDRNGYLEETFFTFSFSPIRDESGGVGGLFHPVTETSDTMLSERRTRTLRDLAEGVAKARSAEETFQLSTKLLARAELDLPFALFYTIASDNQEASLCASTPLLRDFGAWPERIALDSPSSQHSWPIVDVLRSGLALEVADLDTRFGRILSDVHPYPIRRALLLPIMPPGSNGPLAVLVAGISPHLPLGDGYRSFYALLTAGVTTAVANALAHEEQRRRAEALAELDRAKTDFFSNVSHEFRTPLTLMLGPLADELAERENPLPQARRERIELAERNTQRLLKLVNTLLDFSRLEAGRVRASYQPTDLSSFTSELASMFRSAIERAGLTLELQLAPLSDPVFVDREMWEKIVLNLLSNAFKHTFEGTIFVGMAAAGNFVELTVSDTGIGIDAVDLPRLFQRFNRVKGAKSRTHEGTGIGLALVEELTKLHGGQVRVVSERDRGTSFSVRLPRGSQHLPAEQLSAEFAPSAAGTTASAYVEEALHWLPTGSRVSLPPPSPANEVEPQTRASSEAAPRARILWVDDNADMRDYVTRLLGERYEVVPVQNGQEALAAIEQGVPELVLSDVMMPTLDGFQLLRALRADARTRTVPVILLSARAGEDSAVEGLEAGADDYLVKPFAARELLARVRTHLEQARLRSEWAADLERANRELEAFSYSVSHDLRAPLRAIDGFSKAVLTSHAQQLDEQGRKHLTRVRAATARMSELIDDLIDLSRISRASLRRQSVDLTELVRAVTQELREREPTRQVTLSIEEALRVDADPRMLRILLDNLLGNAWKFSSRTAEAHVSVGRTPGAASFFVQDNGAGFDSTYVHKLFQPFQRLHTDVEFSGTGIGLALVQRIAARHGGKAWAEGREGLGATFFFTLSSKS